MKRLLCALAIGLAFSAWGAGAVFIGSNTASANATARKNAATAQSEQARRLGAPCFFKYGDRWFNAAAILNVSPIRGAVSIDQGYQRDFQFTTTDGHAAAADIIQRMKDACE